MKIPPRNYYISAFLGATRSQETKAALTKKYALIFGPSMGVDTAADHLTKNFFYPIVAHGYNAIGTLVSRSLSLVSKDLGKNVEKAWTDPFSSSFILKASSLGQRILTPIAASQQWEYPILRPISQTIIGLARFTDIALKDATTILEMPTRAKKVFTSRPWEAFISESRTLTGKATVAGFFAIYGICWPVIRILDISIRFFQAIAYKIRAGRTLTDTARAQVKGIEKELRNYFIENIELRETRVRKKLVGGAAKLMVQKVIDFGVSSQMRWLLGFGALYLLSSQIGANNSLNSPETERTVAWLMEHATLRSFAAINLVYKTYTYAAFFKEFMHEVEPTYDPSHHTLFYRKNFVSSAIHLNKIKKQAKRHMLKT